VKVGRHYNSKIVIIISNGVYSRLYCGCRKMFSLHMLLWRRHLQSWQRSPWLQCRQSVLFCLLFYACSWHSSVQLGFSGCSHSKSM